MRSPRDWAQFASRVPMVRSSPNGRSRRMTYCKVVKGEDLMKGGVGMGQIYDQEEPAVSYR